MSATVGYSRRGALLAGLCLALVVLVALWPVSAAAEFTPATLLSGTSGTQQLQEFDEAGAPTLSAEGGYAVFQGVLADVPGVYRRDLQTGEVQLVAGGDAAAPSVSANGRYIAFTTTADLEPAKAAGEPGEPEVDRGCPEVYVRDMEPAAGEPEYTLASALAAGEGIEFEGGCPESSRPDFAIAGAQAAPGTALSAGGHDVVFTVLSRSDLDGPGTEPSQVAVRDLQTKTTTLVSVEPDGRATQHGGAFPSSNATSEVTEPVGSNNTSSSTYGDQPTASSASISADASTVAWQGTNVPAQVPSSAAELEGKSQDLGSEVEPLWRRIADGPGASTRRLLAGAGLDFFYSQVQPGGGDEPVVSGSFVGLGKSVFIPPALSANGGAVAVLASAPEPAAEATFGQSGLSQLPTDAYVVEVEDDPAVAPRVRVLTEITDYDAAPAAIGYVKDLAISADGTRVAFDTERTQFELPSLALISPPIGYTQKFETYEANLALGTLQRVTSTFDGAPANGNAGLLAFSGSGQTLAFASEATNLFFGDGVEDASEVYLTGELPASSEVTPQQLGAAPAAALGTPPWLLDASASAAPDGSVLVQAQAPGAGRLSVRAGAQLPSTTKRHSSARKASRAAVAGRTSRKKTKRNRGAEVPTRIVAEGAIGAKSSERLLLRLRVKPAYRTLVAGANGLYTVLRLSFSAPGRKTLVEEIPVTFRRTAHERKRAVRAQQRRRRPRKPGTAR